VQRHDHPYLAAPLFLNHYEKEWIMKKTFSCMAFLLSLVLTTTCFAGVKAGTFSLSPYIGGYTFDGVQHLETAVTGGLRGGYNFTDHVGLEGVLGYLNTESTRAGSDTDVYNYRLEGLYHFFPESRLVPFLAAGYGGLTFDPDAGSSLTKGAFNYGAGMKYFLNDWLALRADVRHLIMSHNQSFNNVEYTTGVNFNFGAEKPAPAPVIAAVPSCTLSAVPASIIQGQSAKLNWSSGNATECNIQPNIGPVKTQGSMDVTPSADTFYTLTCTGEGGKASSDASIAVAAPAMPQAPNCNISVTPASIMKGETATLNWTSQNATDCVIQPDIGAVKPEGSMAITPSTDTAYTLACTGPGGTATSKTDIAVTTPAPTMEELCMTLNIEYDNDKSIIKPPYYGEVEKVANFMKRFPEIKGTIEGHTDSNATAKYNVKLSQRRSAGVVKMLVEKYGIDKSRLGAKGYGEAQPIADNKTKAGRQQNRRTVANFGCVSVEKK